LDGRSAKRKEGKETTITTEIGLGGELQKSSASLQTSLPKEKKKRRTISKDDQRTGPGDKDSLKEMRGPG